MAMPTSAVASAGASLTPSPTMATRRPPAWKRAHGGGLVLRQHLRGDLVDAEAPRHRVGDGLGIAGDHGHPQPEGVQLRDRLGRLRPDLVLEAERAEDACRRR